MKILITGGGTGGHLYPALAVADALRPRVGAENVLFVGSNRGMESREVPEAGYAFRGLDAVGFPRKPGPEFLRAVWAAFRAVRVARAIVAEFSPEVVFSTGGYASAPVVLAAWLARLPIVLHEQNSVPGRANRLASRVAARVFLGFSSARRFFPRRGHLRLSGNPLREQVVTGSKSRAIRQFRLEEGRKTVLVLGGSQGAHSINQAMVDALGYFGERDDVQFLIQSGPRDHEWMVERCREQKAKSWVRRFIPNMGDAYAVADLVVARAGAMTISELAACGLPSILVPYPHAMDNHQMLNADQLREAGAAILIEDRFLSGKELHDQIVALLEDWSELRRMAMNARLMARPDATEQIALALLQFGTAAEAPTPAEDDAARSAGPRIIPRTGEARGSDDRSRGDLRGGGRGSTGRSDRRGETAGPRRSGGERSRDAGEGREASREREGGEGRGRDRGRASAAGGRERPGAEGGGRERRRSADGAAPVEGRGDEGGGRARGRGERRGERREPSGAPASERTGTPAPVRIERTAEFTSPGAGPGDVAPPQSGRPNGVERERATDPEAPVGAMAPEDDALEGRDHVAGADGSTAEAGGRRRRRRRGGQSRRRGAGGTSTETSGGGSEAGRDPGEGGGEA